MRTKNRARDDEPRAVAFATKLRAWLAENKDAKARRRPNGKPFSMPQMGERIEALLEKRGDRDPKCSASTVQGWFDGHFCPRAHLIPVIVEIMETPWSVLDDPNVKWPPTEEERAAYAIVAKASPKDLRKIADALKPRAR